MSGPRRAKLVRAIFASARTAPSAITSTVVRPGRAVETAAVLARAPSHAVPGDC
jgi:hypothetical protein